MELDVSGLEGFNHPSERNPSEDHRRILKFDPEATLFLPKWRPPTPQEEELYGRNQEEERQIQPSSYDTSPSLFHPAMPSLNSNSIQSEDMGEAKKCRNPNCDFLQQSKDITTWQLQGMAQSF